jgi:hypothetical protein
VPRLYGPLSNHKALLASKRRLIVADIWAVLCGLSRVPTCAEIRAGLRMEPMIRFKRRAKITNRASKHRTGNLKENEAGTGIDIGLRPGLKCDQQHGKLQSTKQQRAAAQNTQVARSLHEAH